MKKLLFVLTILCLFPMTVNAARLVSDNATETVESCVFDGITIPCLLNAHGGIDTNIDALVPGPYTVKARYCVQEGLWCSEWSESLPFTKPASLSKKAIRLSK